MSTFSSFDARTGEVLRNDIPASSISDIDQAVHAAHAAFAQWQASSADERAAL